MKAHLGIDFGTTRSVVALCDRGNYPVVSFLGEHGDPIDWYPSVVAEKEGALLYGLEAARAAGSADVTLVRSFKRLLSDPRVRPNQQVRIGRVTVGLLELLTGFLGALRHDLLTRSNLPQNATKAQTLRAVVATPANAHGTQRFLTLDAFRRAGFEVVGMMHEPSAAGFEYAHRYRSTLTARREHVVVYDLGGGTFDASLMRMAGQHHDVALTAGVPRLGGDDFDEVLMHLVLEQAGLRREDLTEAAAAQLRDACREAKEVLNPNSRRAVIDLQAAIGQAAPVADVSVPTERYYRSCEPLVERTLDAMASVVALGEVQAAPEDPSVAGIAGFYVVGGASSLPVVGRLLRKRYGRRVHRSPYPSAATAIGLAIAADPESGFGLTDRFSRAFGVFRELQGGASISFDPIFTRETRMPQSGEAPVVSSRTYRAAHNIGHFRYVECAGLDDSGAPVGDITPFADVLFPFDRSLAEGEGRLREVAVERLTTPGPLVMEQYAVDANGIVEVTIRNLDAGYERTYRVWTAE